MLFLIADEFSEFRTQKSNEKVSFDKSKVELSFNMSYDLFCWIGSANFELSSISFSKN